MPTPKTEAGRATARAYYAAHKAEHGLAVRTWQRANREKHLADRRAWYARGDNAERGRAKCRAQRLRRPDEAGRLRKWRQANGDKVAVALQRQRALKLDAPGRGVTVEEWQSVVADSLGLCAYCSECPKLTMDHIEPLNLGGAHDPENIAAICQRCNSSKRDKPLVLWLTLRIREVPPVFNGPTA